MRWNSPSGWMPKSPDASIGMLPNQPLALCKNILWTRKHKVADMFWNKKHTKYRTQKGKTTILMSTVPTSSHQLWLQSIWLSIIYLIKYIVVSYIYTVVSLLLITKNNNKKKVDSNNHRSQKYNWCKPETGKQCRLKSPPPSPSKQCWTPYIDLLLFHIYYSIMIEKDLIYIKLISHVSPLI